MLFNIYFVSNLLISYLKTYIVIELYQENNPYDGSEY